MKNEILSDIAKLSTHPFIGPKEPLLRNTGYEYRYRVCGDFKILFLVDESAVYIVDIFDTLRNPSAMTP